MILLISGLISDYIKDGEGCRSEVNGSIFHTKMPTKNSI